jgi:Mitochondrial carrier protein
MGLYLVLRGESQIGPDGEKLPIPLWRSAGAGLIAGALGAIVGNPNDVVLVRMQGDLAVKNLADRRGYRNVFDGIIRISRTEGVKTLYTGMGANAQRAALISLGQLAVYDRIKFGLLQVMDEGFGLQMVASTLAGFMCVFLFHFPPFPPLNILTPRRALQYCCHHKSC